MDNDLELNFKAAMPMIQSAIKAGADSMRIQLDVPASDMSEASKLLFLSGFILNVKITVEPQERCSTD